GPGEVLPQGLLAGPGAGRVLSPRAGLGRAWAGPGRHPPGGRRPARQPGRPPPPPPPRAPHGHPPPPPRHPGAAGGPAPVAPVPGLLPVIRHRCDEPSCQAAGHLAAGSAADNAHDYLARRQDPYSPLTDRRGPRGRAVAIRNAILAALAEDASAGQIEAAIEDVSAAGIPTAQPMLF